MVAILTKRFVKISTTEMAGTATGYSLCVTEKKERY